MRKPITNTQVALSASIKALLALLRLCCREEKLQGWRVKTQVQAMGVRTPLGNSSTIRELERPNPLMAHSAQPRVKASDLQTLRTPIDPGNLVSISLTTGSIRVWSRLLCPSTKKAVLWMETPVEETPGGWALCYKGAAAVGLVLITASLLLLVACQQDAAEARPLHSPVYGGGYPIRSHSPHRKLLRQESTMIDQPSRLPGRRCMIGDIVVIQGTSIPLPNGIPAYSVEIINQCPSGCAISSIHLSCGWFSSAHLVNPRVFRRLRYDDCLVNNGMPLRTRETLSFLYANTYPYPLSVSSVSCS